MRTNLGLTTSAWSTHFSTPWVTRLCFRGCLELFSYHRSWCLWSKVELLPSRTAAVSVGVSVPGVAEPRTARAERGPSQVAGCWVAPGFCCAAAVPAREGLRVANVAAAAATTAVAADIGAPGIFESGGRHDAGCNQVLCWLGCGSCVLWESWSWTLALSLASEPFILVVSWSGKSVINLHSFTSHSLQFVNCSMFSDAFFIAGTSEGC